MSTRMARFPMLLLALIFLAALMLTGFNLSTALPRDQWAAAFAAPDIDNIQQMLFHYSLLPRLAISLLVGAGLGLVGVLFQQVLRNPLAEPTTLGVATGAQLGITITTLWTLPGALTSQFAALAGACVVGALVFGVAWGKRLSPVTLILAGLVVSLYCGAINQLLVLFHHDQLQSMFMWSTGTLTQTDWSIVQRLWPQLFGGVVLTLLLLRPLTLMGLDDGVARNLGLALSLARLAALTLAIVLSALLVNAVGIIGFIGLFAPLLAKMLGARRLLARLMLAPLIGALILWLSDQLILWLARVWMEVSTGSVTALIGAPLLLWLLPRLRSISAPAMDAGDKVHAERQSVVWFSLAGLAVLVIASFAALSLGRDATGWHWAMGDLLHELMQWRWPRIFSALIAGVMLAVAGCIIQRLTGNPMASPEVLGISSGAAFGVVLMLFLVPGNAFGWLMPAGSIGAAVTLMIILIASGRGGVLTSPHAAGRDGAQHRVYYAADDVAGERRSAHGADPDLDFRFNVQRHRQSGGAYRDCDDRAAGDCAAVPSLDDHSAAGWRYRPRGRGGADANAYRPVAAGRVPDGDGHHDYRPAQFCRINGAAHRPYDGLPQDFAAYRDLCADGRSDPGFC